MSHLEAPLEENVNRIIPDEGTVEARTIEDAIAVLRYRSFTVNCTVCDVLLSMWLLWCWFKSSFLGP